ncbi:uncharacterized protein N0V89_009410 [Didymosphaeria variabile]|uniref:Uncharacterized protein n=1 Tax=Didymosphaeria variabile TaxID=1932322 RepID=A0A9W8XFH4_9PLEO|nr:uncharacterized protein N0V89_009410 [Didymosphaeria variabile]KAJ4348038.1 hypothetical protein N0V89_009410 [Didymosphaeria variabile]
MKDEMSFDGWLINIEKPFPRKDLDLGDLGAFLRQLRKLMGLSKEIIWYDALTNDNKVAYQNGLNNKNIAFAATCGAVLTNYSWNEGNALSSKEVALEIGLPVEKVYFGIDVWAQNTVDFGLPRVTYPEVKGGGTNTGIAVSKLAEIGLSAGVFAPAWSFEHFPQYGKTVECAMWEGRASGTEMTCSCRGGADYCHPVNSSQPIVRGATRYPAGSERFFYTDFNRAFATHHENEAQRLYHNKTLHSQLGSQSILPHLKTPCSDAWAHDQAPIDRVTSQLRYTGDRTLLCFDAIRINPEFANNDRVYDRDLALFQLDMPSDGSLQLKLACAYFPCLSQAGIAPTVTSIYLKFTDGIKCIRLEDFAGFQRVEEVIQVDCDSHSDVRLQELGVRITSAAFPESLAETRGRVLEIYEISIVPRSCLPLEHSYSIHDVKIEKRDEGAYTHWRLRWTYLDNGGEDNGSAFATSGMPCSDITGPFSYFAIQIDGVELGRAYALEHVLPKTFVEGFGGKAVTVVVAGVGFDGREIARYERESVHASVPFLFSFTMADLQDLLALLHGQGAASNQQPPHGYQQPSVSSPIFSPSPSGPHPHHQSAIMSPNSSAANTPGPEQAGVLQQTPQQQSTQLLNLLRFNSQPSVAQARRPSQNTQSLDTAPVHGRAVSASDLVAGFTGGKSTQAPASAAPLAARLEPAPVSSQNQNQQDLLMRLLNPKPAQSDTHSPRASAAAFSPPPVAPQPETAVSDVARDLAAAVATLENLPVDPTVVSSVASPMRVFGSEGPEQSQFEPEPARSNDAPRFTYRNPFEQLEAASPRNRTPAPETSKAPTPTPKMEILKHKHGLDGSASTSGEERPSSQHKYRKLSPGDAPHETVAEAVSELGEQVGKEIEQTLEAEAAKELARMPAEEVEEIEEALVETASEIKKELEDDANFKALEKEVSKPIAASLKQVANDIAQGDVADSWESAEDSPAKEEDQTVIVYRFPMRAFASITVQDLHKPRVLFSPDLVMDVARLKKEFDQIDRSLVTASKNFIVYAIVKKGGFRIIRQENGNYRQVFEHHQERLFNVALCVGGDDSSLQSVESVLGIGVNGTVFWASVDPLRDSEFDELDKTGLVLPPSPSQDDNTSGGQLKTRAKPSSRHPEFFAIGRGKAIHIIWPRVANEFLRSNSRIVHTEKYYKERSLKILTGKAGKDFTFSEDDTVIVSLDKAGRMRFWDIRPLIDPVVATPEHAKSVEVSETMLEFHTTSANAKSWPTSVFFFDKDKPFNKGIALRYVMVGMKQNHAFQLWDLGLGKAVQEINLPHEKESDAICSVGFHPKTGIMAVAHPTRNSIFFVHVSCPRYNLPVMNQATYISRIVDKSSDRSQQLPPVNATAIMTSITEYSFSSKGQIRSIHMLNEPAGPADVDDPDNTALFELYVMHSKGVCTLRIRRSDLGWKKEGEPMHPKEAQEEGVISIAPLKPAAPPVDDSVTSGDTPGPKSVSDRSAREAIKKESNAASRQSMTPEAAMRASTLAKVESKQDAARAAIINGSEKSEKKKKKRSTAESASQVSTSSRMPPPPSYAQAAQSTPRTKSPAAPESAEPSSLKASDAEIPEWAKKLVGQLPQQSPAATFDSKKLEEAVQAEISKSLSQYTDSVSKRLDDERRAAKAQNGANQEALLRLVSSTLSENVEGVIRKMVDQNMREVLLPSLLTQTSSTLEKNLGNTVKAHLGPQLYKEIPEAVSRTLKSPQIFQSLSEQVSKKVAISLEQTVTAGVGAVITPALANVTNAVENKLNDQLRHAQIQQRNDLAKINQLTETVQTCLQTIQAMAASQAELQAQVNKLQQHLSQTPQQAPVAPPAAKQRTPEEVEAQEIFDLLNGQKYEQATMQWVQSPNSNDLFDTVFIKCNPGYLGQISPLLILSTGAVVTTSLQENLVERLVWLDTVLRNIDPNDPEVHDVVPKIMEVIKERLTHAYMRLNENSPGDGSLRRIASLVKRVNDLAPRPSYPSSHVGSYVSRA